MKNSIFIPLFIFITAGALNVLPNKDTSIQPTPNVIVDSTTYDTSKLDSLEQYKQNQLEMYENKIKDSYKVITHKEKEQAKLHMSVDSIYCLVFSDSTLN
jgi:hypothetical protein